MKCRLFFFFFFTSKTKVFLFSLCLFPCKRFCCIAIVVSCTGFLYFAPLLLTCSSECLTNLKGLPLVLCPTVIEDTGYVKGLSYLNFLEPVQFIYVRAEEERKTLEDLASTTQRSGLLAAAQPIQREEELGLFCLF